MVWGGSIMGQEKERRVEEFTLRAVEGGRREAGQLLLYFTAHHRDPVGTAIVQRMKLGESRIFRHAEEIEVKECVKSRNTQLRTVIDMNLTLSCRHIFWSTASPCTRSLSPRT